MQLKPERTKYSSPLTSVPRVTRLQASASSKRTNSGNMGLSGRMDRRVGLIVGSLRSIGSVRILWLLYGGFPRWLDQVFGVLLVLGSDIVNGANSLQSDRPGCRPADRVEGLTGVDTEGGQCHRSNHESVIGVLLIGLRGQRQQASTSPPGDEGSRPAHCVAMQGYGRVHGDRQLRALLPDYGGSQFLRLYAGCKKTACTEGVGNRHRVVRERVKKKWKLLETKGSM